MKVLHLITGLNTGGAETVLSRLLPEMRGIETQVVSMINPGPLASRIEENGITVHSLQMRPSFPTYRSYARLRRILTQFQPDILQTWMYHADLLGGLAGRTLKIPVIWNLRHSSLKRGHNRQSTIAVARANALLSRYVPRKIVAVSEEAARSHSKFGYDGSKMCVIPNGFDTGIFSPSVGSSLRSKLGLSREHLLVGMVGRFHPLKNHRLFVEAAARIHHSLPSTRFLLCGKDLDSHNTDLVNWIREAGIEKQFFLLGYREDIPEVLGSLDLFLSTSWSEGFPNSLGEAMSCGVPCLATDVGGTSQLLKDPSLLVLPGDALALSHSVLNLLSLSSKERESVGMALRERVKTHFSLSAASKGYRRLYEEVLKR